MQKRKISDSYITGLMVLGFASAVIPSTADAAVSLNTAANYGVLAATAVTNTGFSVVTGDVGVGPGTSITGFPPGLIVQGSLHSNDGPANVAKADALVAYTSLAGMTTTQDLTGVDLGGLTLFPGVYSFSTSAQLTGILTLNGLGMLDPVFVFKVGSTLTTAANSAIILSNGTLGARDVFGSDAPYLPG